VAQAQWGETNLGALPSVLEGVAFDFSSTNIEPTILPFPDFSPSAQS